MANTTSQKPAPHEHPSTTFNPAGAHPKTAVLPTRPSK